MTLFFSMNLNFAWGTGAASSSASKGYPGWQISVIHRNWIDMLLMVLK